MVRGDLAEVALADRVVAPHYVSPVLVHANIALPIRRQPNPEADCTGRISAGDAVELFDISGGWAWVRAGDAVGYVPSEAIGR